jgi:hypothetical protein
MKNLLKVSALVVLVLALLAGCELFNAINVAWNVDSYSYDVPSGRTTVFYTVQNQGKIDLTGVNLEIGVEVGGLYITGWTPDFTLSQNQIRHGSFAILTGPGAVGATVLGVDMDDPQS